MQCTTSEPLEPNYQTLKAHDSGMSHTDAVLLDSRRVTLGGLDYDVEDLDQEVEILDGDDNGSSELINVFEQQHISLKSGPPNR